MLPFDDIIIYSLAALPVNVLSLIAVICLIAIILLAVYFKKLNPRFQILRGQPNGDVEACVENGQYRLVTPTPHFSPIQSTTEISATPLFLNVQEELCKPYTWSCKLKYAEKDISTAIRYLDTLGGIYMHRNPENLCNAVEHILLMRKIGCIATSGLPDDFSFDELVQHLVECIHGQKLDDVKIAFEECCLAGFSPSPRECAQKIESMKEDLRDEVKEKEIEISHNMKLMERREIEISHNMKVMERREFETVEEKAQNKIAIRNLNKTLQQMESTIQEKDATIQEKDSTIQDITQEKDTALQEKDATIQEKDATIQEKDATIQAIIQEKDATIQAIIQEKDATIQEKDATIQEKDATIQEKDVAIQKKEKIIQELRKQLSK